MTAAEAGKRAAAEAAVDRFVESGMRLGLGTGSTATYMLEALAARLRDGRLERIAGVPTSERTRLRAGELGIPLATLEEAPALDVAIDGADEVDPRLELIKGLGGAELREKIVACAARAMVVIGDASKLVPRLGLHAPLPVEVIPFARPLTERLLREAGWSPRLRLAAGAPYVTDEGNVILDCRREDWGDLPALDASLHATPGVVEHGLFLGIASFAVIAGEDGRVRVLSRPAAAAGA